MPKRIAHRPRGLSPQEIIARNINEALETLTLGLGTHGVGSLYKELEELKSQTGQEEIKLEILKTQLRSILENARFLIAKLLPDKVQLEHRDVTEDFFKWVKERRKEVGERMPETSDD